MAVEIRIVSRDVNRNIWFPSVYSLSYREVTWLIVLSLSYLYEHREVDDCYCSGDEHWLQGHVLWVDQQDQSKRYSTS